MNIELTIHTIDEVPDQIINPFIGLIWETSLAPEIIMAQDYEDKITNIIKDKKLYSERGSLIGWFYFFEIMPRGDEYLRLVHVAAKNKYYKDLVL